MRSIFQLLRLHHHHLLSVQFPDLSFTPSPITPRILFSIHFFAIFTNCYFALKRLLPLLQTFLPVLRESLLIFNYILKLFHFHFLLLLMLSHLFLINPNITAVTAEPTSHATIYNNGCPTVANTNTPPCGAIKVHPKRADNNPATPAPAIVHGITCSGSDAANGIAPSVINEHPITIFETVEPCSAFL